MKQLLFSIAAMVLLLLATAANAQPEIDDVYYKPETSQKTSKISIEFSEMTNDEALNYVIKTMLKDGYVFDNIDEKYMFATTKSKDFVDPEVSVVINVFVDNHHIIFTGKLKILFLSWSTIQKTGTKGSPARIAWNELERVAGLFQ